MTKKLRLGNGAKIMDSKTVQRSALCRSRRELSNEYLLAKIGVDTAENEPLEDWGKIVNIIHWCPYWHHHGLRGVHAAAAEGRRAVLRRWRRRFVRVALLVVGERSQHRRVARANLGVR